MEDKLTRLICDLEVDSGSGSSNAQAASPARLLAKRLLEDGKVSRHPYSPQLLSHWHDAGHKVCVGAAVHP